MPEHHKLNVAETRVVNGLSVPLSVLLVFRFTQNLKKKGGGVKKLTSHAKIKVTTVATISPLKSVLFHVSRKRQLPVKNTFESRYSFGIAVC